MALTNNYFETTNMLAAKFEEFDGENFYQFIFPSCESSGELKNDYLHPNAIYLFKNNKSGKEGLTRRIMLKNTWHSDFINNIEANEIALCSGLAYRGRANTLENAQQMNALVFDLDGVGRRELENLIMRFTTETMFRPLPQPTFLVCSGNGLHLYYVFEQPIELFPNIKLQVKNLKYDLTFRLWDYTVTSQVEKIQYQSINQTFRMVGSINSKYGNIVRAFKVGEKTTIEELNKYISKEENKVDLDRPFRPTKITRAEAREKYPEWYERVVAGKAKSLKKWDIAGKVNGNNPYALYDWWLKKGMEVVGGHRYHFMFCMAVYASKCDVPYDKLKKDMQEAFERLKKIKHDNELVEANMLSALESYSKEYYNFTIDDIVKITGIEIRKNKRNGRKQKLHLERARAVQAIDYPNGEWREGNGRPKGSGTAQEKVQQYRKEHPKANKAQCNRDTGLDPKTIRKWWDSQS
jgi:hypothetical protein